MNRTEEKLNKFSYMVMKEADARKRNCYLKLKMTESKPLPKRDNVFEKAYNQIHESWPELRRNIMKSVKGYIGKQANTFQQS